MTFQLVIERNNETVAFLQQQDYSNAVLSSIGAMTLLQEFQQELKIPAIVPSADGATCEPDCLDQCMMLASDANKTDDAPQNEDEEDTAVVYDKGIMIPHPSIHMECGVEVISAILIFNSALAHQLYAQQQQLRYKGTITAWQHYLLRSKRLYELAFRAYSDSDQNVLFQFAIMNNIAVIELQTGNTALSKQYFEVLTSILMVLVDQGCWSRLSHLRGFVRNVFRPFLQVKTASAA